MTSQRLTAYAKRKNYPFSAFTPQREKRSAGRERKPLWVETLAVSFALDEDLAYDPYLNVIHQSKRQLKELSRMFFTSRLNDISTSGHTLAGSIDTYLGHGIRTFMNRFPPDGKNAQVPARLGRRQHYRPCRKKILDGASFTTKCQGRSCTQPG